MMKRARISSFTVLILFVALAVLGVSLIPRLTVKLSPSRDLSGLTVSFSMPGSASRVVESEVTGKVEAVLARIQGVKSISSRSDNGYGSVRLELDRHADIAQVRFEASTVLRQVWEQLPAGVTYPQISSQKSDDRSSRPFMTYTINAPAEPAEIQRYVEENLSPTLSRIPGIYRISLSGATPMEWHLTYDNEQLESLSLKPEDVQNAISTFYQSEFRGIHRVGDEWMRVTTPSPLADLKTADIVLPTPDGKTVALDQLVSVERVAAQPTSIFRINGLNSIYLSLEADDAANQLDVSNRVYATMQTLRARLPQGYQIDLSDDQTESIREELAKIYFRTGLTVLILVLFVALITLNLRYLLLIIIGLAVNLLIDIILYDYLDVEIQLYSLAGITISLNLIIDNLIVMTDHLLHRHNRRCFTAILAATLTTMGALVIVFFLDDDLRLNLQDFVRVILVNLATSLAVALWLVPALVERLGVKSRKGSRGLKRRRWAVRFSRGYERAIGFMLRFRPWMVAVAVLAFGLPVFLLPTTWEGEGAWARWYNQTYKEKIRPVVDPALGSTLRLFVQRVYEGSYFSEGDREVTLSVYANLPYGSTLQQMDEQVHKMESYLTGFKEIRQFQTTVYNPRRAGILIRFQPRYAHSGFPYQLKSNLIQKALTLGGGSWSIYGLQDQGFSNNVEQSAGSYEVTLSGYNYDDLEVYARQMKALLLQHPRIKEVAIVAEFSWWKDDYTEYYLEVDKGRLAKAGLNVNALFGAIQSIFGRNLSCGMARGEEIWLSSKQGEDYDVWALMNVPFRVGDKQYKASDFATLERRTAPMAVVKKDQQYTLCLQYEYIGTPKQGRKLLAADLETFNRQLPIGYKATSRSVNDWEWRKEMNRQYLLLIPVAAIIFFITSILFNSWWQPLVILAMIPISFIGVFLVFYLFSLRFDQGGFASFILLSGITVNASIYLLNEYNALRQAHPSLSPRRAYLKAWNVKITAIFLTVVSTVLGFIPFIVGSDKESFWFPLAIGTMGGMVMSLVALLVYLPLLALKRKS